MYMSEPPTPKLNRWTITASPALIDDFRHLAREQKRSVNSELIWALEPDAKQEQRNAARAANASSLPLPALSDQAARANAALGAAPVP